MQDIEEFYNSPTRLVRELEKEGFDFMKLLHVLFDNDDMERTAQWIKKNGKNQRIRTASEIQKSYFDDEAMLDFGEFLNLQMAVTRKVFQAMKGVVLDYLPMINLLETDAHRSLNAELHGYASVMVGMAVSKWEKLALMSVQEIVHGDEEKDKTSLQGRRQTALEHRKNSSIKGSENSPVFCVEILEIVEEWEPRGWNKVRIWYKLTCAEGEWCDDIDLENLMEEALLYFPAFYNDAMSGYRASSSPRPRHPAMLRALKREAHDLVPVLASYVANRVDFMPRLREEIRLQRLSPGEETFYESRRRWEEEDRDPLHVEEFQIVNLLRDGLLSEGMTTLLRELTEFHIRAPKYFLDYMDNFMYTFIDPLNDLHEQLEKVFEWRRGYKIDYD